MRAKSLALLVLALGCGLVASIGITQVMSNKDDTGAPAADEQTVFVTKEQVPAKVPLTADVLRLENWPKDKVPEGALTKIEDIEGRLTKTTLVAGLPVVESNVFKKGEGGTPFDELPPGYRALPVRVDIVTGGSNMIKPRDRVDLLWHVIRNPAKGIPETRMLSLLQDVRVFAVNDVVDVSTEDGQRTSIKAATVSLVVTPQQAMKVSLASEEGKLRLVPRSPMDNQSADYTPISVGDLLGDGTEMADRTADTRPVEPPVDGGLLDLIKRQAQKVAEPVLTQPHIDIAEPEPAKETWKIRLVMGPSVRDMELVADAEDPNTSGKYWRLKEAGFDAGFATASDPAPGAIGPFAPAETGEEQGLEEEGTQATGETEEEMGSDS